MLQRRWLKSRKILRRSIAGRSRFASACTCQRLASTARMGSNDVILRAGIESSLAIIDLRFVCSSPARYANPSNIVDWQCQDRARDRQSGLVTRRSQRQRQGGCRLDLLEFAQRALALHVPGVQCALRLEQHDLDLL